LGSVPLPVWGDARPRFRWGDGARALFNGTLALFNKNGSVNYINIPTEFQVSGENVTFSFVAEIVSISLTIVLVAFVVFELRGDYAKHKQNKEKEQEPPEGMYH
jgi:hypothetical protein